MESQVKPFTVFDNNSVEIDKHVLGFHLTSNKHLQVTTPYAKKHLIPIEFERTYAKCIHSRVLQQHFPLQLAVMHPGFEKGHGGKTPFVFPQADHQALYTLAL